MSNAERAAAQMISRATGTPLAKLSAQQSVRQVKPFASKDKDEARLRVKRIYKIWQKWAPEMRFKFYFPQSLTETRLALKREFMLNKDVRDPRAIDILVHKAEVQYYNSYEHLNLRCHIMSRLFPEQFIEAKPTDFMGKFLSGKE